MSDDLVYRLRSGISDFDDWEEAADRIEELEANLAKAVAGVKKLRDEWYMRDLTQSDFDTTLAELKGER